MSKSFVVLALVSLAGASAAQVIGKAQVGNLIRKVEDGVDEFQKYLDRRGESARTTASTAQAQGRRGRRTATESQKANASAKKDELDDALGGRSFVKGAASAGFVYYSQWKVTNDSGGNFPDRLTRAKNRAFGLGPEITMPFFAKGQWAGLLTFRYYWEVGVRSATEAVVWFSF